MTKPRTRPEAAKPARAREPRPKRLGGGHQPTNGPAPGERSTPPRTGSAIKPPPGMVTVTRTVGNKSETFTGTVADLRRLGVVKPT